MAMAARAAALWRSGVDVVSLSQGEPDFPTPIPIQAAAIRAMSEGRTGYTEAAGLLALREAVAGRLAADYGLQYAYDQVTITAGAKQAIFNAFFATLDEGDEVIIPAPCWVSYPDIVKLTGGTPMVIQCPRDSGYKLTPRQLEASITPRTKWLMLNSPSNPTGAVYTRQELLALGSVLLRHPNVWLLTDDIYDKLIYTREPFVNLPQLVPELRERTLVVNGLSKVYSMTGWRIGYAAGPKPLIQAMNLVQGQSTNNANAVAQYAAIEALTGDQACVERFRTAFRERRDFVVGALRDIRGFEIDTPEGAFYAFVSCSRLFGSRTPAGELISSDRDLVRYLLEVGHVATVSGTGFLAPGHLRISYAAGLDKLDLAMRRISQAIGQLK
jgi:aspartate aminotransferase